MRLACLPRILILAATIMVAALAGAAALEVEDHRLFPADGPVTLKVISTTDTELFVPLILAFQQARPGIAVNYTVVSSAELHRAITEGEDAFDVALSSAMDLQTKLANDGLTRTHRSAATEMLPDWANWRDNVFAFTQEPATIVISPAAFEGLEIPRSRQDLITLLRRNADRFRGRVGTYDVRTSGVGYLFATQDARTSETYWRLTEVMGGLDARLYCCSGQMIEDVARGHLAAAYNVLGSYAQARKAAGDPIQIIAPDDFTTVMLRLAVIPATAPHPEVGGEFVDFLLEAAWGGTRPPYYPFQHVDPYAMGETTSLRPIRIGPGLLVFLDDFKRRRFLNEWNDAILR